MGISGLWDAVSAAGVSGRVELLRGRKVAIDASFWISHCLASETNRRLGNDVYGVFFLRICYLLEKRILPIFVFDGRPPEAKRRTLLRRTMERQKLTRNLKLLAFKALAVQMKHLAKDSKDPIFKESSFMKSKGEKSMQLEDIANDPDVLAIAEKLDASIQDVENEESIEEERLFSSGDEYEDVQNAEDNASVEEREFRAERMDILSMPKSYKALKMLSRSGANVDLTNAGPNNVLDINYFNRHLSQGTSPTTGSSRSKNLVELPMDCSIKKESYEQLPGELRYQIMHQIKDAWMYEDRVNLLEVKSSLSEFSNLQVESYLRDVEINREIENIKRVITKDLGPKNEMNSETNLNLERFDRESLKKEIFDYNTVESKTRKKGRFLNDLSMDMLPEPQQIQMKREVKQEPLEADDSAFLCDAEIFGDLVKKESDDEFELVDERESTTPRKVDDNTLVSQVDSDWDVEEETYVPFPPVTKEDLEKERQKDLSKIYGQSINEDVAKNSPLKHKDTDSPSVEQDVHSYPSEASDNSDSEASINQSHVQVSTAELNECISSDSDGHSTYQEHLIDGEIQAPCFALENDAPQESKSDNMKEPHTRSILDNASVSASNAIMFHHEDEIPELPESEIDTIMYRNEAEYMDFLNTEKLLTRMERSRYNKEEWEKVPELLELFGVPFMVAPSEAEAQCAHFNNIGLCYGVISDDSDTLAFGASRVFKHFYKSNVFEVYMADRIVSELGLGREQIALLAIICGCDYTAGVRGIGIVNALEVIKAFPNFDDLYEFRRWATSEVDLSKVIADDCPVRRAYKAAHVNYRLHWSFCTDFPNREAYNLFLSPVVSDTFEPQWKEADFQGISQFMEKNSSLSLSEVATCMSRLSEKDNFGGFIIEDFLPEIHASSGRDTGKSLKSNRKGLQKRMNSFREFLETRSGNKSRKPARSYHTQDSTMDPVVPVAYIRSKRMIDSIEGIKKHVNSQQMGSNT